MHLYSCPWGAWGPFMPYCTVHLTPSWDAGLDWGRFGVLVTKCAQSSFLDCLGCPGFFPPVPRRSCLQAGWLLGSPVQAGDSNHLLVRAPRGKKLCRTNQNVLIGQSDPRNPGQVQLSTAGAEGSSPCLALVWLCKDLLGWRIVLFIDHQGLCWSNKSCCVCLAGWISSLCTGRRSRLPFSPSVCIQVCCGETQLQNCSLGFRGYFCSLSSGIPFIPVPTHRGC